MHVKAGNALLVRLLMTLTGATLGAMAGASMVSLLRTWHIWSVSPTTSTLSSIGGACGFGALWWLLMRAGPSDQAILLSRARRHALIVAMALFMVTAGGLLVVITISALTALRQVTFPRMLGVMFIAHGAAAVMITEVARTIIRPTSRWSDRQHFTWVGVVWALLFASGAFLLWRVSSKLTWS